MSDVSPSTSVDACKERVGRTAVLLRRTELELRELGIALEDAETTMRRDPAVQRWVGMQHEAAVAIGDLARAFRPDAPHLVRVTIDVTDDEAELETLNAVDEYLVECAGQHRAQQAHMHAERIRTLAPEVALYRRHGLSGGFARDLERELHWRRSALKRLREPRRACSAASRPGVSAIASAPRARERRDGSSRSARGSTDDSSGESEPPACKGCGAELLTPAEYCGFCAVEHDERRSSCAICGTNISHRRSHAETCSARCKKALQRRRAKTAEPSIPPLAVARQQEPDPLDGVDPAVFICIRNVDAAPIRRHAPWPWRGERGESWAVAA